MTAQVNLATPNLVPHMNEAKSRLMQSLVKQTTATLNMPTVHTEPKHSIDAKLKE
jgi:hypothetical protein